MTSTDRGVPQARERVGEQADPYGHGHSTAAWAAVFVVMLGALVISLAVVFGNLWLGIAGGRRWPAPGRRFEREEAAPAADAPADDAATWDALSRGEDPT